MIKTILSSPEHAQACKERGYYGHLVHYIQAFENKRPLPKLPGEAPAPAAIPVKSTGQQQLVAQEAKSKQKKVSDKGNEKALNYFTACLRILELEDEVALTEDILKTAYKKSVLRAHPDKPGGSEKEFEAVTRAFAYLGEILRRMSGGRQAERQGAREARETPSRGRGEHLEITDRTRPSTVEPEPIRLNPDQMDMNAFNRMFEKTRIPDPEESGYGDWLKDAGGANAGPTFSGEFNRDVFNKMFEEGAGRAGGGAPTAAGVFNVQEQVLSNRLGYGTELGRSKRDDYTAANDDGLQYTDLKKAYTEYNMFSQNVANVTVENRSFDQMVSARKEAPRPLEAHEQSIVDQASRAAEQAEQERQRRIQAQAEQENDFFARMKRLVNVSPSKIE